MGLIKDFFSRNKKEDENKIKLLAQVTQIRSLTNELRVKLEKAYAYDRKNSTIRWFIERFKRTINYIEEIYYFVREDNNNGALKNLKYLEKQINMNGFDDKFDLLINLNILNRDDKGKAMSIRSIVIYLIKIWQSLV